MIDLDTNNIRYDLIKTKEKIIYRLKNCLWRRFVYFSLNLNSIITRFNDSFRLLFLHFVS